MVFMLDSSGSINRDDFSRVLNFVRELASRLDVDAGKARVGLVAFADQPKTEFRLNQYATNQGVTRGIQNVT